MCSEKELVAATSMARKKKVGPRSGVSSMEQAISADCYVRDYDRQWNWTKPSVLVQPNQEIATSERQAEWLRLHFCYSVSLSPNALNKAAKAASPQLNSPNRSSNNNNQHSPIAPVAGGPNQYCPHQPDVPPNMQPSSPGVVLPLRVLQSDVDYAVMAQKRIRFMPKYVKRIVMTSPDPLDKYSTDACETLPSLLDLNGDKAISNNLLITKYCDTLEHLLFAERRERLLLFERYSKFKNKRTVHGANQGLSFTPRLVDFPGIADAQPQVQPGDIVVFRPCTKVFTQRYPYQQDAPSSGIMEIQAQVMSVIRSNSHVKSDRIQTTWLDDAQVHYLAMHYVLPPAVMTPWFETNVRVVEQQRPLARCLTAVDWLRSTLLQPGANINDNNNNKDEERHILHELLFPTESPVFPDIRDEDVLMSNAEDKDDLNPLQLSFVRVMLQRTLNPSTDHIRGPAILTGPAGTGKTRTMLAAILRLLALNDNLPAGRPRTRILVCTPSHTAANVITKRLGRFLQPKQLFRLVDASRPINTVINVTSYNDQMWNFTRRHDNTFSLPSAEDLLNFDVIVSTCSDAHLLYIAGCTNQQLRIHRTAVYQHAKEQLQMCGVSMSMPPEVLSPHFTHLFIDEAAQATEAETLIPISVVTDPQRGVKMVEVALVGDPRQLSPQVFCTEAADAGLGQSWIERLLRQPLRCTGGGSGTLLGPNQNHMQELLEYSLQSRPSLSIFLTQNYRGHAAFLSVPSALFYSDLLQCAPPKTKTLESHNWFGNLRMIEGLASPAISIETGREYRNGLSEELLTPRKQFGFPIHFRGVVGVDESATVCSGFTSNSWANRKEADAVVEIIKCLVSRDNGNVPVHPRKIGVMAPFRGQVDMIRKLLRAQKLSTVDVGTIEDYQAVEWDVIVLSLTRSTTSLVQKDLERRMGVFGQPKRSNVALTRAENLFIVVGNPNVMMEDFVWRQFLLFCHRNGLWYGEANDTALPSHAVVTANVEELTREKPEERELATTDVSGPCAFPANLNGVVVSSLERLLRSSNII